MRFHVPNNELEQYYKDKEDQKSSKPDKEGKVGSEDEEDSEEEEITASKLFNDKIVKKAKIG